MQLFYHPDLDKSVSQFSFSAEESRHIVKVLRKGIGDVVHITNGKGYLFEAKIIIAAPKRCIAEVISTLKKHPDRHRLHLVVAPTKMNDRYEYFLEKATEIGVHEITPILCEHSERKVLKMERMQRVILAAMKQSQQYFLPKLNEAIAFAEYIALPKKGHLYIAHCDEGEKSDLKRRVPADNEVTVLIGPEGDFSPKEIATARENGFIPVSLGPHRLRTETAAIVACTTVALINNS
ncbi:16S rRNA (uracil(1498)-N(3))-methyltransferase [Flavobacteriaceae bacterium F89]|uniref:Ribosomal RNA small subunit methyltransferase E n=1 Tax=Cerina litoralis TaxID=2874477 RepID=A0AAE3JRI7_9FLAO|nr:16S rRNA (uracil(1498)-N(3))-methyltransferase [Cerina litoralis]MCG2459677.1 16S rRNA (uracil(1498)-N(3))-methyltransferase [Cerina litoralis]